MSLAHDALLTGFGVVNSTLRGLFFPETMVLTLLKPSETTNSFDAVLELGTESIFEYSAFRQQFRLEIARDDAEITAAVTNATHVAVDDEIYSIVTPDTVAPLGFDVTWKLFCERFASASQFQVLR